ncbi:MAG: 16S rRNA (adenine(1518)-N(6)/adenine(1519)-N(6))-dimethyltransferase RsmA [Oscillospiraceae bacterium]|jgi:16S rRNA (adenine1518-N6/adenine1519-N6)-dimethyltransferase|nr:16S rRNA (adenine(1518)-N(6)/adenine(1519)-N(6))-dimethyltransferase RsmA [Oscillospiraceae bacterium]
MINAKINAKKQFGQNFITDEALLAELVDGADLPADARVLEIGAGMGSLTRALARCAERVTAVEIDRDLERVLRKNVSEFDNVNLVIGDAMKLSWNELNANCLAANLPYYITSQILSRALQTVPAFRIIAVMVQREVADKLAAAPREEGYGPLSVWARGVYDISVAAYLPPSAFTPPPNVDSAFVVLRKKGEPIFAQDDYANLERVISAAFAQRRKTIANNMKRIGITKDMLEGAGISALARAEELDADAFVKLANIRDMTYTNDN